MSQTTVVHCMRDKFDVYIGRPNPKVRADSYKWGNPFRIGDECPTLDHVIRAYEIWFLFSMEAGSLRTDLPELKGKKLGCWCAPKGGIGYSDTKIICHGQLLAYLADHPEMCL